MAQIRLCQPNRALLCALASALLLPLAAVAIQPAADSARARLGVATGGAATVRDARATGVARFVTLPPASLELGSKSAPHAGRASNFFAQYGSLFGIADAASELSLVESRADERTGGHRLTYHQRYQGVPVFAAVLRAHFDAAGDLRVVNGTFVPKIGVAAVPKIGAQRANEVARAAAASEIARLRLPGTLAVKSTELVVFREGLVQGVAGESRLAWKVDIGDGASYGEEIFVDAHSARLIDRIPTVHDAMNRRAFDSEANYPGTPFWLEGQAFPTYNVEADNVIRFSKDAYEFFFYSFGHDSWDDLGGEMDTVFNRTTSCPNASWNGVNTSYCPGVTGDDTVAHEWGHAYTDATHNLIYQWQSGALNESYSDIWGETVDILNWFGDDFPGQARTVGTCSSFANAPPATLTVPIPSPAAGTYVALTAGFGAPVGAGVTDTAVLVTDTTGGGNGACTVNGGVGNAVAINGNIALIRRGDCPFVEKVLNAQNAGAVAVIMMNNIPGPPISMGGADPSITIPSAMVSQADGNLLAANSPILNANLAVSVVVEVSYRWVASEDDPSFGNGIRDMWEPTCFGNPGKVSDGIYVCGPGDNTNDQGGVHTNSGVPNHGFALLVDGGTSNGVTVTGLGIAKASHIYWRAQSVYQVPVTDFSDHADALRQSCEDLEGDTVEVFGTRTFKDSFESGDTSRWGVAGPPPVTPISLTDCDEVDDMALAVELRDPPAQCGFVPLLDPAAPAVCGGAVAFSTNDFEAGVGAWTVSRRNTAPVTFESRDWILDNSLPGSRPGQAFFGPDPVNGDCAADLEFGVLMLTSPSIAVPTGDRRLRFDHWIATEATYDGGNLKISIDGGTFTAVPAAAFTFNAYNDTLVPGDNPNAGEAAFSGANDGSTGSGSWGQSQLDLDLIPGFPGGTSNIVLRFEMSSDGCNGAIGWFVDDVVAYTCP